MSDKRRDMKRTARMPDAPPLPKEREAAREREASRPSTGERHAGREAPTVVDSVPPPRSRASKPDEHPVEVLIVREEAVRDAPRSPWRAYEIWTMNRVYGLDATFRCVEVLDRTTGKIDPESTMIGARFGGGRRQRGNAVVYSYPFPLEGSEAMFIRENKYGCTSPVERIVVRVREFRVRSVDAPPSWEELAGRADGAPSRREER
jgi:hypothetical protein